MKNLDKIRGSWPACECPACVVEEAAFLLLSQRTRIQHTPKKPDFGDLCVGEVFAQWLLSHASPWFIKENHV